MSPGTACNARRAKEGPLLRNSFGVVRVDLKSTNVSSLVAGRRFGHQTSLEYEYRCTEYEYQYEYESN